MECQAGIQDGSPEVPAEREGVVIESNDSGTIITGPDIEVYRVLAIRRGMILFIDTGLSVARVSPLNAARRSGLVPASTRTNRTALKLINRWLTDRGASAAWSKTYPEG